MTQEIVDKWLNDVKNDLADNYDKLGLRASGNWPDQLETFNTEESGVIKAGILGAKYTGAIENGRSKNSSQEPEAINRWAGWAGSTFIKKWCEDKGVNINPYAVAYKIAREGWKVPNRFNSGGLVSDVITDARIKELGQSMAFAVIEQTKSEVIKIVSVK